MDLKEFTHKFTTKQFNKEPHISTENINKMHDTLIESRVSKNPDEIIIVPIEEMSELTQHLSKIVRGKEQGSSDNLGLIEEMADVQLCLDNLKRYFKITDDDIAYAIDIKVEREYNRSQLCTDRMTKV